MLGSLFNSKKCAQFNDSQNDCNDAGCKFEPDSTIANMWSAELKNTQTQNKTKTQ